MNPETLCAEGIILEEGEWEQIEQEVKCWPDLFLGRVQLKRKTLPVLPDPFGFGGKEEDRRVLLIEVYPVSREHNSFFVKIAQKGMQTRFESYGFDSCR